MGTVKLHDANVADEKFWGRLKIALTTGVSEDGLDMHRALAIASKFVGMLLAAQDQRKGNGPYYMEIVAKNIESGNKEFIDMVFGEAKEKQ